MSSYLKDIQFNKVVPNTKIISHKQALLTLAQHASAATYTPADILLKHLSIKEKNADFSIGDNIAVPHIQLRNITRPFTMLMTSSKDIHHDTPDGKPLHIYALLISPLSDGPIHLRRLSRISRLLKNDILRKKIRETHDEDIIQSLLTDPDGWLMAAA